MNSTWITWIHNTINKLEEGQLPVGSLDSDQESHGTRYAKDIRLTGT